jgi:hypothetical protein
MKRHPALAPLSRDHHHALVIAQHLRRATTQTAPDIAAAFLAHWNAEQKLHFRLEEELLLPAYAAHGQPDHPAIIRMLLDHMLIRCDAAALTAALTARAAARARGTPRGPRPARGTRDLPAHRTGGPRARARKARPSHPRRHTLNSRRPTRAAHAPKRQASALMLDSRPPPANRRSVRTLVRILADACIGTRPGTFQSLRRAPAFATQQGSCQRGHLPCVAGKAGLNAAAGGHLPCAEAVS